ncbi:hypothetical protein LINPERPRIM_LOCUS20769 [Linum perenne]
MIDAFGQGGEHDVSAGVDHFVEERAELVMNKETELLTHDAAVGPSVESNDDFNKLMKEGGEPLYKGCLNFSRLSFLLRLYHIKYKHKISNNAMKKILELLRDAFGFANYFVV